MSFFKINRKKDPPDTQEDSDILGEPASVDKENVKQLETMLKGEFPQNGISNSKTRYANIISIFTIASVILFFVSFFAFDLSSKIVRASATQPVAAVTSVSSNEQPEATNSVNSSRIVVLPRADITKDDLLSYLGDMPDEDMQTLLQTIETQKTGSAGLNSVDNTSTSGISSDRVVSSVDPVVATDTERVSADIESESTVSRQVDASNRLRLIQDLNTNDIKYYVAEDGDTLLALSKSFGVSLGQLLELNGMNDADVIRAGEILLFPGETKQPELHSK